MAVQARQQQQQQLQKLLENASTTCLPFQTMGCVADNNGNRGGTGWPPCHEGLVLDAYLQQQPQQQPMGTTSDPTLGVNQNAQVPVGVPLASLFLERQRREEDQFILQQAESFRLDLQRLRRKHAASMMKLLELKASALLKRREEEVAKVVRRTVELEEFIRRGEMEVQTWQKVAREHEVVAMDLSQRLERIQNSNNNCYNVNNNGLINCFTIVDESSCCSSSPLPVGVVVGTEEEEERDGGEEVRRYCRWCHSRDSNVLFLPCRHLSTCKICSEFLTTCPVCSTTKQGSFEVFMS